MTVTNALKIYSTRSFPDEDAFQIATAELLDTLAEAGRMAWFHPSPNTYRRALHGKQAMILGVKGKRMGVKAGVPDCIIHSHKLAIELKVKNRKPTENQQLWMTEATKWGWKSAVCWWPSQVVDTLVLAGIVETGEWK